MWWSPIRRFAEVPRLMHVIHRRSLGYMLCSRCVDFGSAEFSKGYMYLPPRQIVLPDTFGPLGFHLNLRP